MQTSVKERLAELPRSPGVYLFRDERGDVLYVGKAKSLRSRVRSYFQRGDGRVGTAQLVSLIADVEVIVTRNEAEALFLSGLPSALREMGLEDAASAARLKVSAASAGKKVKCPACAAAFVA